MSSLTQNNKRLSILVSAGLAISVLSSTAIACDMHGGFGFAAYGRNLSSSYSGQHAPVKRAAAIELSFPYLATFNVGESGSFELGYTLPNDVTNASVTIMPGENMALLGDSELTFDEASGSKTVNFVLNKEGTHAVKLLVTGKQGQFPVRIERRVYLRGKV